MDRPDFPRSSSSDAASRDTIYALASAPGRAGVAVVRVSGPNADAALAALTKGPAVSDRKPVIRSLYSILNGDRIDEALILRFAAPRSYTGENIVEFQVHGGQAVIAALLSSLADIPGLRHAEAGEFTRRAVLNGRIDLTQAEAIADLVAAETEAQRRQALTQFDGRLGSLYEDWRTRLIRAAAWIEAGIDFAEEDIPDTGAHIRDALGRIAGEIRSHLDDGRRGEILRDGFQVAIIGPPNAGKSSLLNALVRRDVAIVSPIPGTTRDVIEVRLDLQGYPVILADTAGLRESADAIEEEGMRRAQARAAAADLKLLVQDATLGAREPGEGEKTLTVWNKADLVADRTRPGLWVSAKTGEGLPELIAALASAAASNLGRSEAPIITRVRYRDALGEALRSLEEAQAASEPELSAEHVRLALRAIGRITGRVDLDDLLDVVFREFCIGK
jgi:tRNA modification GTPase